jgi:hypothetical protein
VDSRNEYCRQGQINLNIEELKIIDVGALRNAHLPILPSIA